jgi:cysteinyl-tRNA synthetase
MSLAFYDALTRTLRPFAPLTDGVVRMYACGPTIYDVAHIGNFRSFVTYDLVHRVLAARGYHVRYASNLTDVDDKTIRGAAARGQSLDAFTAPYGVAFHEDSDTLGIRPPTHVPCATAYIPEMLVFIQGLLDRAIAYRTDDGSVYFRIASFPEYGALSGLDRTMLRPGARIAVDESKDEAADFALWKASKPEDEAVGAAWNAPWGRGRPGWHIECSVMATSLLGPTLDLHLGGEDLKFPHHEDEVAQSEASTGKPFVRQWIHVKHLLVDGRKMSKSLGNFYTLRDLVHRGYRPSAIRHLLLSAHYRTELNFTLSALDAATVAVDRLTDFTERLAAVPVDAGAAESTLADLAVTAVSAFNDALDDDLNVSAALAALYGFVSSGNAALDHHRALCPHDAATARAALETMEAVVGTVALARRERTVDEELATWVETKIAERGAAKTARDYARADVIRAEVAARGVTLEDGPMGTRWKRAR